LFFLHKLGESRLIVILAALGNNVSIVVEPTKSYGHISVCERAAAWERATDKCSEFQEQQPSKLSSVREAWATAFISKATPEDDEFVQVRRPPVARMHVMWLQWRTAIFCASRITQISQGNP
jgi:hypothetical protein